MSARPGDPRRSAARMRGASKPARAAATAERAAALPAMPEGVATRACWAALAALVLMAALRAGLGATHGMAAWGLNTLRFLPPAPGWPLWALASAALIPALARPLAAPLARLGDTLVDAPWRATLIAAPIGAGVVLALPDRVRFVGDFLLRQGTVEEAGKPGLLFPQALPLDVFLHVTLPTQLIDGLGFDANSAARAVGAVEAAVLAALSIRFARTLGVRGATVVAVAAIAWWSGALSMFTGYSKAFAELSVLSLALVWLAIRALRTGAPPLAFGILFGLSLTLHRSAIGFAPLGIATWALWGREHGASGAWKRPATWIALAIPIAMFGLMVPKLVATFLRWDAIHLTPAEVKLEGGPLRAAFYGNRPADLASLLLMLAPLLPAALAALAISARALPRKREALLLAALVVPLVGVIPFLHPAQGMFRDWDDFACAGAATAAACAWMAGESLRGAPRFSWLALGLALAAAVPSFQWLVLQSDLDRGLKRVEAIVAEPPPRTDTERGNTWDFLGIRNFRLQRWEASATAFAHAAETAPSPRILHQWAVAETEEGHYPAAQKIYRRMLEKSPDDLNAWSGLAAVSSQLGDTTTTREAALQMLRLQPGEPNATLLLRGLGYGAPGGSAPHR
ncbi:MAG TPA: tetratricopeptide repeat protein [Candidatus Sulfotelmatobacter sp.]|nr:tetratricopeptide repeat protein [Candidatus Sulfotelmatobacter sp.]